MLYTYKCRGCGREMDRSFKLDKAPGMIECPYCKDIAKRVLAVGHGGIRTDSRVSWLPSACKTLLREDDPPIETRTEYKRYLKKEGLIATG